MLGTAKPSSVLFICKAIRLTPRLCCLFVDDLGMVDTGLPDDATF